MIAKSKIFISYSTEDHLIASSLYNDLSQKGAEVFQFEESATPGMAAWNEVLEKIENSDVFILLASKSALKSRPVQEEIKFAYYQYVNCAKPSTLLPVMLEHDLRLPRELRAINQISFDSYEATLQRILGILCLESDLKQDAEERKKVTQSSGDPKFRPTKKPIQQNPFELGILRKQQIVKDFKGVLRNPLQSPAIELVTAKPNLVNTESVLTVIARYTAVIISIACLGGIVGLFANSWLRALEFGGLTGSIRNLSEQWTWLPWVSKIAVWIIIALVTFNITDEEIPVDSSDYAFVSVKSVGVTLFLALGWSFLFSQVVGGTTSFVWVSIGIEAGVILLYAILNELT